MRKLPFFIVLCCSATSVWAIDIAPFSVGAGYTLQADSNPSRTPNGESDQVGIATLGLGFNTTQSLQKLEVNLKLVDYNYQSFDNLSYTALNYDAAWRWAFTPRWTGVLSSSRNERLDSEDAVDGTLRNLRVDTNLRLDTTYELDGPWRLVAGAGRSKQRNEQAESGPGDDTQTNGNAGVRYVHGSGSTMTYRATAINGTSYDLSGFQQFDHDLRLSWVFGGRNTLDANITHLSRSYSTHTQHDYSGFAAGIGANWAITGKTMLNAAYSHELSPYTTLYSNYAATDRVSLGANWEMSPKASLRLSHVWSGIDYRGDPGSGLVLSRRDTTRGTGLSFAYQPTKQITLNAGLQYLARSSNLDYFDYDARLATLTAQFTY
jgi:exopolysaccharide biosynthesis operon protein EpsL